MSDDNADVTVLMLSKILDQDKTEKKPILS